MLVESSTHEDVTVIALIGELDRVTAAEAGTGLTARLPDRGGLLLDLSRMSYLSSAGLRVLLLVYRQARMKRLRLAVACVPPDVRDVMAATGFLDAFLVAETVEAGLAALRQ
jgi:anti-anti-sigma factor